MPNFFPMLLLFGGLLWSSHLFRELASALWWPFSPFPESFLIITCCHHFSDDSLSRWTYLLITYFPTSILLVALVSPFARCLSSIILFPVSGVSFNSLPFFQWTISVFQQISWQVFLSGEPCFVVQKLSLLAPLDSSLHRQPSPPFFGTIKAATCHHLLQPSFLIFSRFVRSIPLQCNLGAPPVQSRCTYYHHGACLPPIPFLLFFFSLSPCWVSIIDSEASNFWF